MEEKLKATLKLLKELGFNELYYFGEIPEGEQKEEPINTESNPQAEQLKDDGQRGFCSKKTLGALQPK